MSRPNGLSINANAGIDDSDNIVMSNSFSQNSSTPRSQKMPVVREGEEGVEQQQKMTPSKRAQQKYNNYSNEDMNEDAFARECLLDQSAVSLCKEMVD